MPWLPAVALIALALIGRRLEGRWLAPGTCFAAAWAGFVSAPLLLASQFPEHEAALWWIVLCALVVLGGSLAGSRLARRPARSDGATRLPKLSSLVILLTAVGLVAPLTLLSIAGQSPTIFLSFSALARVAHNFSVTRYGLGGYRDPALVQVGEAAYFAASLFAGLLLADSTRSRRIRSLALLPFVPAAGVSLLETTKAGFLLSLALLLSAYLAARLQFGGVPRKAMVTGVLLAVGLIPASIFVQLNRANFSFSDPAQVQAVLPSLEVAAFGSVPVFTFWFDQQPSIAPDLTWGAETFAGPANLLLNSQVPRGHTGDFVLFGSGIESNVYTMFRDLIDDFGVAGSLLALALFGFLGRVAFDKVRAGSRRALAPLSAVYAVTFFGLIINPFSFTTVCVAWIVLSVYLVGVRVEKRGLARRLVTA